MAKKTKKPDCYKCRHRREIPGNAHTRCVHPKAGGDKEQDPLIEIMGIMAGAHRFTPFSVGTDNLGIKGSPYGIRNGWFVWPLNFDPVWLESCNGFSPKGRKVHADTRRSIPK